MASLKLKNTEQTELTVTHEDGVGAITVTSKELSKLKTVDTISGLRSLTEAPETLWVSGYHAKDDGAFGSNIFRWNATSVDDDNGGTIIKLDSIATGRYELQYDGAINVKWFGAVGDGVADDKEAIQASIDYNYGERGTTVYIPKGLYAIGSKINITNVNTDKGLVIYGESMSVTSLCNTADFADDCMFEFDGTGAGNHKKLLRDFSIADTLGLPPSGYTRIKYINGSFENTLERMWFSGARSHVSIDQSSLGVFILNSVFDLASNVSIKDASYKPSTIRGCTFTSLATGFYDIDMTYDTGSPLNQSYPKSFGGEVSDCIFVNADRALGVAGNNGIVIDKNKFQCTSSDVNRFVNIFNCKSTKIVSNEFTQRDNISGVVANFGLKLYNTTNYTVDGNAFNNLDAEAIQTENADYGIISNNVFSNISNYSILFNLGQSRGITVVGNLFESCGTPTEDVIYCTPNSQTRITFNNNVFQNTDANANDIYLANTTYTVYNLYTTGTATDASFGGVQIDF